MAFEIDIKFIVSEKCETENPQMCK